MAFLEVAATEIREVPRAGLAGRRAARRFMLAIRPREMSEASHRVAACLDESHRPARRKCSRCRVAAARGAGDRYPKTWPARKPTSSSPSAAAA